MNGRRVLICRSPFFQSRRHFPRQAKGRSTTQRFGITAKGCNSLRRATGTLATALQLRHAHNFWTTIALDFVRIYFDEESGMNEQSVGGVEWNFGDVRLKKQPNGWLSGGFKSEVQRAHDMRLPLSKRPREGF